MTFLEHPGADADSSQCIASRGIDKLGGGWLVSGRDHVKHFLLRFREQVTAIQDNAIGRAQDIHAACFFRARGNFCLSHLQEGTLQRGQRLGILDAHHRIDNTAQHFFRAAACRDDSCTEFHQSDVRFSGCNYTRAMHGDLATPAQGKPGRRNHNGFRRVAHPHVQVLQFTNGSVEHLPHALLRAHDHHEEVCAGAEVLGFAADNKSVEICFEAVKRLDSHVHDIFIEGVHLGMEFEAGHAVTQVTDGRAHVLRDNLLLLQDDHALGSLESYILPSDRVIYGNFFAVLVLVKRLHARFQHVTDPFGSRIARGFHLLHSIFYTQHIPRFERASLVHEAPAHRVIDRLYGICHFWNDGRCVLETLVSQRLDEMRRLVIRFQQDLETVFQPFDIFCVPDRVKARLSRRNVFERIQIEGPEFLFAILATDFLIKTDFRFVTEPFALQHRRHQLTGCFGFEILLPQLIMRNERREVASNVIPHIQPDQVDQAEGCRLRSPDQWTGNGVHFIDGVTILQDVIHRKCACAKGDSVANEIWRVLAQHNSLAQAILTEPREEFNNFFLGIFCRNDFQQLQIARRVEEMRPKEMLLELF